MRIERSHVYRRALHEAVIEEETEQKIVDGVAAYEQCDARHGFVLEQGFKRPAAKHDCTPEGHNDRNDDGVRDHWRRWSDVSARNGEVRDCDNCTRDERG